jgi:hypothetical protein
MPLDVENYLRTPPKWSLDGQEDLYEEALEKLNLKLGSHSSLLCPIGGHDGRDRNGIKVYHNGVMCFSGHGVIPKAVVVEKTGLKPKGTASLLSLMQQEVGRFAAKLELLDFITFEVKRRQSKPDNEAKVLAKILFSYVEKQLYQNNPQWVLRLKFFYKRKYPQTLSEFWSDQRLYQKVHPEPQEANITPTYYCEKYGPRKMPNGHNEKALLHVLTPSFHEIKEIIKGEGEKATTTIEVHQSPALGRFLSGEAESIKQSPLYELINYSRPIAKVTNGWDSNTGSLPRKIITPRFTFAGTPRPSITSEFINDLRSTFIFTDAEMPARYLGYLIQPMIVHLGPGQYPAYLFEGPTNSGKGLLGQVLPGILYCSQFGPSVCESSFKGSQQEMSILLGQAIESVYLFIDEIIFASKKDLKFLDNLTTQQRLQYRVLNVGYASRPNHLTIAMSAISKNFSDETKGRLVDITLTETSNIKIKGFLEKWRSQAPELLKDMYQKVSAVDLINNIPSVENRRGGFGLLKKVLQEAFHLEVSYKISYGTNDILDIICLLPNSTSISGTISGPWQRYTPKAVAQFYALINNVPIRSEHLLGLLNTALGFRSTESHPAYKEHGYPSEDGNYYHIKLTEEKQGKGESRRHFIYVKKAVHNESKDHKAEKPAQPVQAHLLSDSRFPSVLGDL